MLNFNKKIYFSFFCLVFFVFIFSFFLIPPKKTNAEDSKSNYTLLAPLGNFTKIETQKSAENPCPFGDYLNTIIKITIGVCAVLAMIMIVWGGIQYMTSELASSKEAGKKSITQAVFGLLLALASYVILNTINPALLNACLNNVEPVTAIVDPGGFTPGGIPPGFTPPTDIFCPKTGGATKIPEVLASLEGKVTYRLNGKGYNSPPYPLEEDRMCDETPCKDFCPTNTLCLDCSGFTDYVLMCAGLTPPGGSSGSAFTTGAGLEAVNATGLVQSGNDLVVNGAALKPGDLLGWLTTNGSSGTVYGHVMLYVGNGMAVESRAGTMGRQPGNAYIGPFSPKEKYGDKITHFFRIAY